MHRQSNEGTNCANVMGRRNLRDSHLSRFCGMVMKKMNKNAKKTCHESDGKGQKLYKSSGKTRANEMSSIIKEEAV